MQDYGDLASVKASEGLEELTDPVTGKPTAFAGTMGESKRMEALTIAFDSGIQGVSLKYQAHVEGDGWLTEVPVTKEGTTIAGTKNQYRRMEALKLTVNGLDKLHQAGYEIKYRAHVEGYGWQDWVTADDKAYNLETKNFAGTTGEYKRVEAIEIAVVHVHQKGQYTYNGETEDGVSQHTMICPLCKERIVEDCTYGEWETSSQDENSVTRSCVCGHKETKKLQALLKDNAVTEVEVNKVNTTLTVPANKTLTVDDELGQSAVVTVKGALVIKGTVNTEAKLQGNGKVIWAPEAETAEEFQEKCGKLANSLKLSGSMGEDAAKTLKYEIRLPEMEEPQTVLTTEDSDAITIGEGYNITLDLGKNEFALKNTSSAKELIVNKANLTIKNGTLTDDKTTNEISKYVLENKETGKLTLEDVTINTKNRAIGTVGDLAISNSTIHGKDSAYVAVKIGDLASADPVKDNLSKKNISLDNVKIDGVENGLVTLAMNATVALNDVNVVAKEFALTTNALSPSKNNSYIVTGGLYKVTNKDATVAYLASTGKSTFTNCTLEGDNGIETSGTELTLDRATIKATGRTYWGTGIEMAKQGEPTKAGAAVLLRVIKNYGDKAGIKLVVKNSTLSSTNGYAVNVAAGEELNPEVKNVDISYDTVSYNGLDGKCGPQYVDETVKALVTTHYDVVEE